MAGESDRERVAPGERRESPAARRGPGRGLTLDVHRPIEGLIGIILMVVPFLLRFGPGDVGFSVEAIVVAAVIGVPIATLGFAGGRSSEPVSPSLHSVLDRVLTGALLLAAVLFALAAQGTAAIFLGLGAAAYGVLAVATRYAESR